MCGIAGCSIKNYSDKNIESQVDYFIKALHHRGPDRNGFWIDEGNILFTHNRLSIQDLSEHGHQPMMSASGRYVLIFNGEIYNFLRLKSDLEFRGVGFRGHSDTEVILALVDTHGLQHTLQMIDGMFAFALYDRELCELTIARDRMGEKPLFYGWIDGQFAFASELKALRSPNFKLSINRDCIGDFLSFGYIPTPYSIYQDIYKLTPGTSLTLSESDQYGAGKEFSPYPANGFSPKVYWDLKQVKNSATQNEEIEFVLGDLEAKLGESVSQMLVADVPVGCFLSGGIDSSLVAALAQKQLSVPLKTFTIGFDVDQFDEAPHAREVARHLGTDHHETYVGPNDVLALIEKLPEVFDEPFADPSQLPAMLVSSVAKKEVTVCLSGDGGDELFAGYNRYSAANRFIETFSRWPKPIKRNIGRVLLSLNTGLIENALIRLRKIPGMSNSAKQANIGIKLQKLGLLMKMTSAEEIYLFLLKFNGLCPDNSITEIALSRRIAEIFSTSDDFIAAAMLVDQLNYLVDDNLAKVDRSAMSESLEVRLPLLDRQIVELSWNIPTKIKLRNGEKKWPLREILYKHVPRSIIERPKMGFSVPISAWLRNELKGWSRDLLENSKLREFVEVNHYLSLWEDHQKGYGDYGLLLWPVLVLSQWLSKNT